MLNKEQKRALSELSRMVIKTIMDEIKSVKAEKMVDNISLPMTIYMREVVEMGNPTLSELAARMGRSKPSVTIAIDKLERMGYVKRIQADKDRRSFHIHLTDKGRQLSKTRKTIEDSFDHKISSALNDREIVQFIALNKKIFK